MSEAKFLEKLLDGADVEWLPIKDLTIDKFWIMPATPKFDEAEDIPYITSKNIRGGHIDFNKVKFISRSDYINLSRNRPILAGDVLISMIGTIGEVARVKDTDLDFYGQNMYLIRLNPKIIDSDYFLHFFDSPKIKNYFGSTKNNSGQGYLKANNIEDLEIPIPCSDDPKKSLAIQAEIVRILDALAAELTAELTAELSARKKQYNYYRDQLLTFVEGEVEWRTLPEMALDFGRGKSKHRPRNDEKLYDGDIPFIQTGDIRNASHFITEYSQTYNELGLKQSKLWPKGTLCITIAANIAETSILGFDACFPDSIIGFIADPNKTSSGYVEYLLQTTKTKLEEKGKEKSSAQSNINLSTFEELKLPFPNKLEQARIVDILDKFDALTNSITEGLPREIELRQKQYEYYRDLLLNFPKSEEVVS